MSYRPRETGYDDILRRPDITISRSTWELVCELPGHGPYLGASWNQKCPACRAARAAAQRAAMDARFHERVAPQVRAIRAARGAAAPGGRGK